MFRAATLSKRSFIEEAVKCLLRELINAGHSIRMCLLRLLKTHLRNRSTENRLNGLALMYLNSTVTILMSKMSLLDLQVGRTQSEEQKTCAVTNNDRLITLNRLGANCIAEFAVYLVVSHSIYNVGLHCMAVCVIFIVCLHCLQFLCLSRLNI